MRVRFIYPTGPGPKKSDAITLEMPEIPRVGETVELFYPETELWVVHRVTWTPGQTQDVMIQLWYHESQFQPVNTVTS